MFVTLPHLNVVVNVAPPGGLVLAPVAGEVLHPVVHRLDVLREVRLARRLVVAEVARELLTGRGGVARGVQDRPDDVILLPLF